MQNDPQVVLKIDSSARGDTMPDSRHELLPSLQDGYRVLSPSERNGLPVLKCGWMLRDHQFHGRTVSLAVPAIPDELLDEVRTAGKLPDPEMPYWAYLWPAAIRMADAVVSAPWPAGTEILELGCGVGLVGLSALSRGYRVLFTDFEPRAIVAAGWNARWNGFIDSDFETHRLDWRQPWTRRFSVILGCDLLYEAPNLESILNLLEIMLLPNGECWLSDGGRRHADTFYQLALRRGYGVRIAGADGGELRRPGVDYQLFQLRRPG